MNNQQLLNVYICEVRELGRSTLTVDKYEYEIGMFSKSIKKSFLEANRNDFINFLSKRKSVNSKNLSQTILIKFYHWLVENSYLTVHPMPNRLSYSKPKRIAHIVAPEKFTEVQSHLKQNFPYRDFVMVTFKFATGLRSAELLNIKVDDLDLKNNSVRVIGKGDKEREVYFTDDIRNMMFGFLCGEKIRGGYIWRSRTGEQISESYLKKVFAQIKKEFNFQSFSPHDSRRCFASWLLDNGVDVSFIQELLGHEDIKTTMIYAKASKNAVKNAVIGSMPKIGS